VRKRVLSLRGVFGWVAGSPAKSPLGPPFREGEETQPPPFQFLLFSNGGTREILHSPPFPRRGPDGIFSLFLALFLLVFTAQAGADSPRDLVASANELYKAGKVAEALESYGRALELAPDSPEILFNEGNAHFQNGEFEKARDAYGRAALLSENGALKAKAHFNLGCAATSEAVRDSEKAEKKSLGLLDVAVSHYKEALKLDPSYRSEAGRGIESARRIISMIRNKVWVESAPEQGRKRASNASAEDARNSKDEAEAAENASGKQPPVSETPKGMEVKGRPQDIRSKGEHHETPADIIREEGQNSGKLRRRVHTGQTAVKDW
jgi:tetratricopeptide (TPR) repeat protein